MTVSYQLPPLPYAYNALEPHIDEHTMKLHHDKHHLSHVGGLNRALERLEAARAAGDYVQAAAWAREAAYHESGHVLHSVFWTNMVPAGGGDPTGALAEQIEHDLGGMAAFRAQFTETAMALHGGGWAVLVWEPIGSSLMILPVEDHQHGMMWGAVPLLALDVWEHAYYLSYRNRRGAYIEAWWQVVNWADVSERLLNARG